MLIKTHSFAIKFSKSKQQKQHRYSTAIIVMETNDSNMTNKPR